MLDAGAKGAWDAFEVDTGLPKISNGLRLLETAVQFFHVRQLFLILEGQRLQSVPTQIPGGD